MDTKTRPLPINISENFFFPEMEKNSQESACFHRRGKNIFSPCHFGHQEASLETYL